MIYKRLAFFCVIILLGGAFASLYFLFPNIGFAALLLDSNLVSHPPIRPLPTPSTRPPASGTVYHVSPNGNDANDGSLTRPWKSLHFAATKLTAGDTLYLRQGIHRTDRSITIHNSGTASAPVTIRSYPGELAIMDFSYPEFYNDPANSWMPCSASPDSTGCVEDEYVSTRKYSQPEGGVYGNFGDSMVPLFRYGKETLRSEYEYRTEDTKGYYTGPGAFFDKDGDERMHVRLSHTTLPGRTGYNYQGETDPRKVPLILTLQGPNEDFEVPASNIRLQDFVVRGHRSLKLGGSNIELDGMYVYQAAGAAIGAGGSDIRILRSKIRGPVAPWTSRFMLKNFGGNLNLMVLNGNDIEIAYSELTDGQDGLEWGDVENWSLHHNVFENFVDDTMNPKGMSRTGTKLFYQNYISGVRQVFGFDGQESSLTEEPGAGLYVYRNIFDLRRFTYGGAPLPDEEIESDYRENGWHTSKLTGDHEGGIIRPSWRFYHNVIASWRGYEGHPHYMFGLGSNLGNTRRWVYNNIEIQVTKKPRWTTVPNEISLSTTGTLLYGGNIHWALDGAANPGDRSTDVYKNPLLVSFLAQFGDPTSVAKADFRLMSASPAINAGVPIPADWPDPLRGCDTGAPDIGAIPFGVWQTPPTYLSC